MAFDPQIAQQYSAQFANDPVYQQLLQQASAKARSPEDYFRARAALGQYLKAKGVTDTDYAVDPSGQFTKSTGLWDQVPTWAKVTGIGALAGAAAPFAMNALGVGAAGGAAGPEGVAEIAGNSGGVPEILGGVGGSKAGSVLGGLVGQGGGLIPNLINIGSRVGGALLGSHAAGKAAQQQERSIQAALDLQKNLYGQSKAALMPYYQLGAGSLGRLGSFLGTSAAPPIPDGTLRTLGGK